MDFYEKFPPDLKTATVGAVEYLNEIGSFTQQGEWLTPYAGKTFGGGIYRLYDVGEMVYWTLAVEGTFKTNAGRCKCFGRDWLGNQFCLDSARSEGGESKVLLFEIGTGKILRIPETFKSFHERALIEDADSALAAGMFEEWRAQDLLPIGPKECVGYKVPLFLGGFDGVENLDRYDAAIYWELTSQALAQTMSLP